MLLAAVLGAGIYSSSAPAKTQELIGRSVSLGGRHIHHFVPGILIAFASDGGTGDEC